MELIFLLLIAGVGGYVWLALFHGRDVFQCQSCGVRMTRRKFNEKRAFPNCGTDLLPRKTGERESATGGRL